MGINTPPDLLLEINRRTGIQVVDGFRYLGIEVRKTCEESKNASFEAARNKQKSKYDKIHIAHLDLFHKKQLISAVIVPAYNHIFTAFGADPQWCKIIDDDIVKMLWTQKLEGGGNKAKKEAGGKT